MTGLAHTRARDFAEFSNVLAGGIVIDQSLKLRAMPSMLLRFFFINR